MAWHHIVGQELAKRILQQHAALGRVTSAYLLVGPDGVGKRRLALEMAKTLNCSATERPCDACVNCRQIDRRTHPDVHGLEPGGASRQIGIEEVRQLLSRIALRPYSAFVQVAIINEADRLTEEAGNSLLKALEEPGAQTRFLLATSQLPRCLPTIISRCQIIRCQPLAAEAVAQIVADAQPVDADTAQAVARRSGGSASQALALADRWAEHRAILDRLADGNIAAWVEQPLPESRQEVADLLEEMIRWLRDVAVTAVVIPAGGSAALTHPGQERVLSRRAATVDVDRCLETAFELMALRDSIEQFVSPRLVAALARERWLNLQAGALAQSQSRDTSIFPAGMVRGKMEASRTV